MVMLSPVRVLVPGFRIVKVRLSVPPTKLYPKLLVPPYTMPVVAGWKTPMSGAGKNTMKAALGIPLAKTLTCA